MSFPFQPFTKAEQSTKHLRDAGMAVTLDQWKGDHRYPPDLNERLAKAVNFIQRNAR
jgi:hypothetical protein